MSKQPRTTGPLRLSTQPDSILLARLVWIHYVCLALVVLIASSDLCGWLIPGVAPLLYAGWSVMKANTAVVLLLSATSLALSLSRQSTLFLRLSQLAALVVFAVAALTLVEYTFHLSIGIDTLLTADAGSPQPGRMSPQTASAATLLAIVMFFMRVRKRPAAQIIDAILFCLLPLIMFVLSGYAFGVMHLFGLSPVTRTAPNTLTALILLSFVALGRRAEYGSFAILVGRGIGSRIARLVSPFALILPFALETARIGVIQTRLMTLEFSTAVVTALASVLGFAIILLLAWRIDGLEQDIRDLSLRDDLTRLYNRRGFFVLAERELQLARRAGAAFSVLFIDLDNLKLVNDKLGHEVGSDFLRETAALLAASFRESDVVGRIGGDEFVIAGINSDAGISAASQRLELKAAKRNAELGQPYPFSFSVGYVTSQPGDTESLEQLLNRADNAMYAAKRSKKTAQRDLEKYSAPTLS